MFTHLQLSIVSTYIAINVATVTVVFCIVIYTAAVVAVATYVATYVAIKLTLYNYVSL